jgi:X-Pro dipeptidyl-peptidase (S15 family)
MAASREVPASTPFKSWIERAEALGGRGRFEIGVPMRDGVELAADVYLPEGAETEPVPAIVTLTPYGKDSETLVSDEARLYQSNGCGGPHADHEHVDTAIMPQRTALLAALVAELLGSGGGT